MKQYFINHQIDLRNSFCFLGKFIITEVKRIELVCVLLVEISLLDDVNKLFIDRSSKVVVLIEIYPEHFDEPLLPALVKIFDKLSLGKHHHKMDDNVRIYLGFPCF